MSDPANPVHEVLARERTALAWSRTALAYAAAGGLAIHAGVKVLAPVGIALGAALVAIGALAARHGERWYQDGAGAHHRREARGRAATLRLAALASALIGVAGLAFVAVSAP